MADRGRMEKISNRFETKSDKIRALSAAGYERAEIARFLEVRYQHVRNVLVEGEKRRGSPALEGRIAREGIRNRIRLKIDGAGRVLIPAPIREAMHVGEDGTILAWLENGGLRLVSPQVALQQVEQLARDLRTKGSLADDLIAERREEAKRETANG